MLTQSADYTRRDKANDVTHAVSSSTQERGSVSKAGLIVVVEQFKPCQESSRHKRFQDYYLSSACAIEFSHEWMTTLLWQQVKQTVRGFCTPMKH